MRLSRSSRSASNRNTGASLRLPNLSISRFCGIRDLTINRLGRVNLIVGMNGAGKTTVLDAVRVFADRGSQGAIGSILRRRDELYEFKDSDGDLVSGINWEALFWQRRLSDNVPIHIGPTDPMSQLELTVRAPDSRELKDLVVPSFAAASDEIWALVTRYQGEERTELLAPVMVPATPDISITPTVGIRRSRKSRSGPLSPALVNCQSIGPGLLTNSQARELWGTMVLTDEETKAVDALNLMYGGEVERAGMAGGENFTVGRPVVRLAGSEQRVPLKSLGDGAIRLFGFALGLANSHNGFLLIDEVENGIHRTLQPNFWEMILAAAHENNIQVFATTHGWDAVEGFATAVARNGNSEGVLVRIERDGDDTHAIEYSGNDLLVAAERGIEVR